MANDGHGHKHEHGRRSSRSILDGAAIMNDWGPATGETWLDVGAGDGHLSLAAARAGGPDTRVIALDRDGEWLAEALSEAVDQGLDNLGAVVADATRSIPLPEGSVDTALLANVFHGFVANEELERFMEKLLRVLAPDGRILVIEFKKAETPVGPPLSIRLRPKDVAAALEPWGFSLVRSDMVGIYHHATELRRVAP